MLSTIERSATLERSAPESPTLEEYWPDIEGLARRRTVTDEAMPSGTFFDLAVIHVLTTATVDRLRQLYPQGRFEVAYVRSVGGDDVIVRLEPGDLRIWDFSDEYEEMSP